MSMEKSIMQQNSWKIFSMGNFNLLWSIISYSLVVLAILSSESNYRRVFWVVLNGSSGSSLPLARLLLKKTTQVFRQIVTVAVTHFSQQSSCRAVFAVKLCVFENRLCDTMNQEDLDSSDEEVVHEKLENDASTYGASRFLPTGKFRVKVIAFCTLVNPFSYF